MIPYPLSSIPPPALIALMNSYSDAYTCNMKIINTIIHEFTKKITLEKEEIENLFFGGMAITLMQSVRFLTDYLNGDSYYKTSYKDQNLVRAKNQWALYKSLRNNVKPPS